jgi:DNA-binding transcriptional ArsR family regulator
MATEPLATLASLLADNTRAAVCVALLDGRAWTAGELARTANVSPQTMTEHLHALVRGGLLIEHRQGRHRYVALAGAEVADMIEYLAASAGPSRAPRRSLNAVRAEDALRRGRTCYDHLAGRLGVQITDAMMKLELLDADLAVTAAGRVWAVETFGASLPQSRRPTTRACLDWTERRPHLGGTLGKVICSELCRRSWITPVGLGRAVRTTADGRRALRQLFGIDTDDP